MSNAKDLASGLIFVGIGLVYGWTALADLPIGSALSMGPGYFPIVLSGMLILMGAVIAGRSWVTTAERPFGEIPWRGIIMTTLAMVVFTLLLRPLGLFLTSTITAWIACFSARSIKPLSVVGIGLGIGVFCMIVFGFLIQLQIPVFGTLFG